MIQATFICCHCGRRCRKNVRLKGNQHYCGSKDCQQSRKNRWERDRLKRDSTYRDKRCKSKKAWYKNYHGYSYQSSYRASHPDYVSGNREKQRLRASRATRTCLEKHIVKTDALFTGGLVNQGFYVLMPYKKTYPENIVKTDALIVELRSINQGLQAMLHARSP